MGRRRILEFLAHPEINEVKKTEALTIMRKAGALIIQAHPFREACYIDHIRLFPRHIEGVEVYNAQRTDFENTLAEQYAKNYGLIPFAGSDNHRAGASAFLGGMQTEAPLTDEADFIARVRNGTALPFRFEVKK